MVLEIAYTQSGHIFIRPGDDPDTVVDAMLHTDYREEFCLAADFSPSFMARLMDAGFLLMSMGFSLDSGGNEVFSAPPNHFILLPKLHLTRSVLFWDELHETRTARRESKRYELRYDAEFDRILERCAEVHGEDWLTLPLREGIRQVRALGFKARPVSFGLYRAGTLVAGEFGVEAGRVYTSYSGYFEESSAGTAQLLLTGRWLRDRGYAFWDLGMPLDYKDRLGARNISPLEFVALWRKNRGLPLGFSLRTFPSYPE
ncbi:MAG: GNAT family N-acetyltransferase [Treponema sp.]|nr:GNAT family N-acetyltransferase [Treponema sp.]